MIITRTHNRRRPAYEPRAARGRTSVREKPAPIPDPEPDTVRTLIFGGNSEIGKNLYAVEYNNTVIVLECGTMFGESDTPGIANLMPDMQYLKERKRKVKALVVTNSSMKHIGAIPHAISDIGNPPIYARKLTAGVIQNRQSRLRKRGTLTYHEVEKDMSVEAGDVTLHFFGVSDKTPGTLGVLIETKSGCVTYTGSLQIEHTNGTVGAEEEKRFNIFKEKKTLLSLADSVNAERPGFTLPEQGIAGSAADMIREAPGRAILPLFPAQIKRNAAIAEHAVKMGRKIYIESPEILENLSLACDLGICALPKEALSSIREMNSEKDIPEKTVIITGTAENEEYESLEQVAAGTNRYITVMKDDTIIFPSPVIATSARSTQDLYDQLSRLGAITISYDTNDIKGSGHANKDELKWMQERIKPKYFIPVQGYHYMLTAHTHILRETGVPDEDCVLAENGNIIDISADGKRIKKLRKGMATTPVSVDGHAPAAVQEVVVRDRKILSQEGIFIIILFIDPRKRTLKKSPDIISRGFIYLRESQDLIARIRVFIKKVLGQAMEKTERTETDTLKKTIQKEMQSFLMNETNKQPIIIPIIFN